MAYKSLSWLAVLAEKRHLSPQNLWEEEINIQGEMNSKAANRSPEPLEQRRLARHETSRYFETTWKDDTRRRHP